MLELINLALLGFGAGCQSGNVKVEGSPKFLAIETQALALSFSSAHTGVLTDLFI
jgi:hypothetical protein